MRVLQCRFVFSFLRVSTPILDPTGYIMDPFALGSSAGSSGMQLMQMLLRQQKCSVGFVIYPCNSLQAAEPDLHARTADKTCFRLQENS
jgi:hypothetical protein